MFIDIHSHILPGADDGAENISDACDILTQAYSSGTTVLAVTPHYNNISQCNKRLKKHNVIEMYKEFKNEVANRKIPVTLFLGSELLVDDSMDHMFRHEEFLTLNGSRYMLVEFPFDKDIREIHEYTDKFISFGIIPVIAHPERYNCLKNDYSEIYNLTDKGCKMQINKGSPLGQYGVDSQNTSIWMLNNDCVHIIASDCHNTSLRNADMADIYSWMLERFNQNMITDLMHDNPKRVLLDQLF